jgi:thiosulfate dehydrogenase
MKKQDDLGKLISLSKLLVGVFILVVSTGLLLILLTSNPQLFIEQPKKSRDQVQQKEAFWKAPDITTIPQGKEGEQILYGRELIVKTSSFIGPLGSVSKKANGMNCQNCHLDGGTKPYGNNYGSVASLYPKFRPRSGSLESIEKRVNDCFERSLNGDAIDSLSKEMRAIVAYLEWLGKDVPKGEKAPGSGLADLEWMDRPANHLLGKKLYLQKCQICHGNEGEGQKLSANSNYIYPPLMGENSFTTGAGLYRISNLAKYIYTNMPNGASYEIPALTKDQAWDIAAYVVSLPRPQKIFSTDWPKIESKPVDHPFGPYADSFSEEQHKYGPFAPIEEFYASKKNK